MVSTKKLGVATYFFEILVLNLYKNADISIFLKKRAFSDSLPLVALKYIVHVNSFSSQPETNHVFFLKLFICFENFYGASCIFLFLLSNLVKPCLRVRGINHALCAERLRTNASLILVSRPLMLERWERCRGGEVKRNLWLPTGFATEKTNQPLSQCLLFSRAGDSLSAVFLWFRLTHLMRNTAKFSTLC